MSGGELLLLLMIALLVLGAQRLPDAGRTVGNALREFRRAINEARDAIDEESAARSQPPRRTSRLID